MAIPDPPYFVVTVPDNPRVTPWVVQQRRRSDILTEKVLEITDAGPTPNPGYTGGVWRPLAQRSKVAIISSRKEDAEGSKQYTAFFHVARGVTSILRPGDIIHIAQTSCAGLGVSVLRDDLLIAGMGAITAVPLGREVQASDTDGLAMEVVKIFKTRDPDFDWFTLPEIPVELQIGKHRYIRYQGRFKVEGYEVMIMHGFYPGIPGRDACIAIARLDACNPLAVIDSAFLIDIDGLRR